MATKEKKPRPKRARQKHLPTLEPESIPRLDDASNLYYDTMLERQKLTQEEKDAMLNVQSIMAEEGIEHYETPDGLVVNLLAKAKVSIKRKKEGATPSENGEAHEE